MMNYPTKLNLLIFVLTEIFYTTNIFGEMCSPETPVSVVLYHFLINVGKMTLYSPYEPIYPMQFFIPESCQKEVEKIAS